MKTALLPIFLICLILLGAITVPFINHFPASIQRSLSFLPLPVDPEVKLSADVSTEWRLKIWRNVIPEIPRYLLLGKGYALSATDLRSTQVGGGNDSARGAETAQLAGDYHSGPHHSARNFWDVGFSLVPDCFDQGLLEELSLRSSGVSAA